MTVETVGSPVSDPVEGQLPRLALVVGLVALVDATSHLVLVFGGWSPETPLRRLAALQTGGTQATVMVLALTLIGMGLRVTAWPASGRRVMVATLALGGLVAIWVAMGIPGLTNDLLADVTATQPERIARGSRQAMTGWLGLGVWALGMAVLLQRWRGPDPRLS